MIHFIPRHIPTFSMLHTESAAAPLAYQCEPACIATPRYKAAYSKSLNDILSYNFLVVAFQKVSNLGNNHEVSCAAIMEKDPSAPSGYYWLWSANGSAVRVFSL